MMMLLEVAFLVLSPVALAYSRYQEHEADRFALDLTRTNHSAGMAFVKLQDENLSNPRPGLLYKIFRRATRASASGSILQRVSSLAHRRTKVGGPGGGVIPQSVGGGNQAF